MITLYNPDNTVLLNVEVEDRSYRIREIMGEHALYLYFSLAEYIEIIPGTYVDFNGERYLLRKPDNFKKNHTRDINYTLKLEPYSAILRDVKFKYFAGSATNFELDFPLTFQPINFLQLIVDNLNANDSGWSTGSCDLASEMTLTFSDENCDEAIRKIAEAFNTEFEVVGKVLHLHKVERADTALPLAYGKDQGFKPGLGRVNVDDSKVINRLYVISSDRNIDNLSYGASTLRLPTSTQILLDGITYVTDAFGIYLEQLNLVGRRVEETVDLSYIYPKREGTVSAVVEVDAENNFYDIFDSSIPEALDFSQYLIEGTTMTIVFQDGNLSGMEFEVEYIHAARQFKLVPKEVNGLTYPQAPDIPGIGDKYSVFNIMLPQTYIDDASQELLDETLRLLADAEKPRYSFTGTLDEIYAAKNWATISDRLNLGNLVSFSDSQFLIDPLLIRITSVKEFVNRPKAPVLELANNITGKSFNDTMSALRSEVIAGAYSSVLRNNLDLKNLFLYKNAPDTAKEHITFAKGLTAQQPIIAENGLEANEASIDQATILSKIQSEIFNTGFLGSGFRLHENAGNWDLEVDNLLVRKNMDVFKLTIQQIQSVGGQILLTPASMTCTSVEVLADAYRCYFNNDGNLANLFQVNDQAICQQFDGADQKRYWRLVTATGVDYIELSKLDVDGTGIPAKGDEIVQLGHRIDTSRQNAILISSYGDPKLEQYKGINGFTLTGKLVTRISPEGNIFKAAEFIVETAGGEENLHTLIQANESEIQLRATQATVDGIADRVTDTEAELVIQADQISSKVTQTEVNTAEANAIATAAADATAKSDAAQIAAQNYAAAQADLAETTSKAYADGIVTAEEQRAIADAQAKADAAQADAISAAAIDAQAKVDAIEVGGRNLFLLSGETQNWSTGGVGVLTIDYSAGYKDTLSSRLEATGAYIFRFKFPIISNTDTFTLSFWYKNLQSGTDIYPQINDRAFSKKTDGQSLVWLKYSDTRLIDNLIGTHGFIDFELYSSAQIDIIISDIKIEKGNKATDWTPAPENVQANIDTAEYNAKTYADNAFVEKTVHQSDITQLSDSISQRVTETDFDANNDVVGQRMTEIEQTADNISLNLYDSVNQNRGRLNKVRYIRDWIHGSSVNIGNHWVELQAIDVNNQNIALGKSVNCFNSSDELVALNNPQYATDGDTNASYRATPATSINNYIQIDLEAICTLRDIISWHYYNDARTYHETKVEVSEDGINWYPVFDSTIEGEYAESANGHTVQNPYVYEAGKAILPTGIDIINRKMVLTADKTYMEANDGTQIAAFVMKDGKPLLQAENIDVENLVAKVLQTQASGARVEVNGISNSIVVYDSNNDPKILLSPKNVMSEVNIASTGLVSVTYPLREVTLAAVGSAVMYTTEQVVISDTKNYTISTPEVYYSLEAQCLPDGLQIVNIDIRLKEVTTSLSTLLGNFSVVSNETFGGEGVPVATSGTVPIKKISGMNLGTYKIEVIVTITGSGSGSALGRILANQILKAEAMIAYQEIGLNGFNFINSATDYVHNSGDNFVIKKGAKSIQVTSSSVKINDVVQ